VKLKLWVFDRIPGSEAAFCAGYGRDLLSTNEGWARYQSGLGLELLAGLLYWQKTGQAEMLAEYQARFAQWLTHMPAHGVV